MSEVAEELRSRGEWRPLMHLFPTKDEVPGHGLEWGSADLELQAWMADSPLYQQLLHQYTPDHPTAESQAPGEESTS